MNSTTSKHALSVVALLLVIHCLAQAQANTGDAEQIEQFALELVSTKSEVERNLLLAARKHLVTPDLRKELVKHGNLVLAAGEYSSALSIYTMVEDISKRIADTEGSATASLNIGTVNYFQGQYGEAVDHYRAAHKLFLDANNKTEAAKALFGLGLALQEKRELDAALDTFERAYREFLALNNKEEISNTLNAIGSLHYARGEYAAASRAFLESARERDSSESFLHVADAFYMQGEYVQALTYYEKILGRLQVPTVTTLSALGSAANCYYYVGDYDRAIDSYQKALAINEGMQDKAGAAIQLQGLGNTHRGRGNFGAALDSYFKSLSLSEQASLKLSIAQTLGSIGIVRALQGQNTQALEYFQKSLAQFEANGDRVGMARMLSLKGNVNFIQSNFQQALDSYQKSLALRQAMQDKTNSAHNLTGIGTSYLAMDRPSEARESYDKALALFQATGNQAAVANVLTKIAEVHLSQRNYQEALVVSQRAAELARQAESFGVQWYALTEAGKAQRLLARPAEARVPLLEAIALVDSLRFQPATGELGAERSGIVPFQTLLEIEIDQNMAAEAFQLAERAKLVALRELLTRSRIGITKGLTPTEQTTETRLTTRLFSSLAQRERQEEQGRSSDAALQKLRNEHRAARAEYESFVAKMYAAHPDFKLYRGEVAPIGFDEAGTLLRSNKDALLEFAVTESNTYLFVLTDQKIGPGTNRKQPESTLVLKAYPLNITGKELAERLDRFRELLLSRDESFRESSRDLYDVLLRPAEQQLVDKTNLAIVPDGALWGLTFDALQPADDQYLIDSKTISYVSSLSVLREMRKRTDLRTEGRVGPPRLAAFASPMISKQVSERLNLTYSAAAPELKGANGSLVDQLKSAYPASVEVISGAAATEDRLKAELNRNGVIHLETPVLLDEISPMYSTMVLSDGKTSGLFPIGQLFQLNSTARACVMPWTETLNRTTGRGNAEVALSWAWFVAGTPTLILGHPPTESGSREQLMVELHRKLKVNTKGSASSADALRIAALAVKRTSQYHHPYYWSGFAVLGDAR
jgi:tetratricopeptide (TPR) repeat protein